MTAILGWYTHATDRGIVADSWVTEGDGVGRTRRKIVSLGGVAVAGAGTLAIVQRLESAILTRTTPELGVVAVESALRLAWEDVIDHAGPSEAGDLPDVGADVLVSHPAGMFHLAGFGDVSSPDGATWLAVGSACDYLLGWVDGRTAQLQNVYGMHRALALMAVEAACGRVTSCRGPVLAWTP